jgi:hypothetical protein
MPKIEMLKSALGADAHEDGRTHGVKMYDEGKTYEVGEALARAFCEDMKVARRIPEKKMLSAAPENKAHKHGLKEFIADELKKVKG